MTTSAPTGPGHLVQAGVTRATDQHARATVLAPDPILGPPPSPLGRPGCRSTEAEVPAGKPRAEIPASWECRGPPANGAVPAAAAAATLLA